MSGKEEKLGMGGAVDNDSVDRAISGKLSNDGGGCVGG